MRASKSKVLEDIPSGSDGALPGCEDHVYNFNMEFAFGVEAFSNCTLRLCIDGAEQCASPSKPEDAGVPEEPVIYEDILVNSAILAAKSGYFLKLFTSEMQELQCQELGKPVCIQISREEKLPMIELLQLMYRNKAPFATAPSIEHALQLLFLADRFEVVSCFSSCAELLKVELSHHMTFSRALLLLRLPPHLQRNKFIRPLMEDCSSYIAKSFQTLVTSSDDGEGLDAPELTLEALQKILKLDSLNVNSENQVFVAALKWTRMKYEDLEMRQEVMAALSLDLRFPWMSAAFLVHTVLPTPEMERCSSVVLRALTLMVHNLGQGRRRIEDDTDEDDEDEPDCHPLQQPRISYQPSSRSVFFEIPASEVMVWRENATWQSQSFHTGKGHWFTVKLIVKPFGDQNMQHVGCYIMYSSPDSKAESRIRCRYAFNFKSQHDMSEDATFEESFFDEEMFPPDGARGWGICNLLGVPLEQVIADKEVFFPDGALQLRVDVWNL